MTSPVDRIHTYFLFNPMFYRCSPSACHHKDVTAKVNISKDWFLDLDTPDTDVLTSLLLLPLALIMDVTAILCGSGVER